MEKKNNSRFIGFMYWFTKLVFWMHLVLIIFFTSVNYFDLIGYAHGEAPYFTLRGDVNIIEENWKPLVKEVQIQLKDSVGVIPTFLFIKSGFARIDYTDFSKIFTFKTMLITLLDLAYMWIWIVLTFQLMKIISSLKNNVFFDLKNIKRLRYIALVFAIAPIIESIKNVLFAKLLRTIISIPHHFIWSKYHFMMYYGIGIMLTIFVLIEILKYGLSLKQENDLTI